MIVQASKRRNYRNSKKSAQEGKALLNENSLQEFTAKTERKRNRQRRQL
jgi:hypothetical protein